MYFIVTLAKNIWADSKDSKDSSYAVPLHQVSEQVHDLLLKGGPVLNDGVSFVGHLLLKLLQLLDLLTNLELRLGQGCNPG